MKSDTLLDYAVFQLSPKHSRCELFVSSDGTTEKVASGLVKPFAAQMKLVEEQVALSVESIKLEVERRRNAIRWFTKGTVERFVRFVSTPEILELVNTLDAEMSQLEAAQKLYSQGASSQLSGAGASGAGVTAGSDATKKELLRAIDVRLSAVKQDLTTALYGAASAGFNEQTVLELQMFSDHFSARRLNDACNKFFSLCERRPELISVCKVGLDDQAIRCSYGSDMSIDEEPTTPEQKPSRSKPLEDDHSGNACQAAEAVQPSMNQQAKDSSKAFALRQSRESSVEKDDTNNRSEPSVDKEKEGSVADKADSVPKGQHVRRLSVQDRINLFENKQKETSGSGGKPVVAKSVELKRLPSDVQEKAVLRRWSGASDMSIDLGGDKKDIESPLCTPSYASASQNKPEDKKGLHLSDSTSSNKQDFKAIPGSVIDSDSKIVGSSKNGEAISEEKQSTVSSSKFMDTSEGVRSISGTNTAESDAWIGQSSLNTHSKFSVNLVENNKDEANSGEQFEPSLGADTENFGLANRGKQKGCTSGNEPTKIRGRENHEGFQDTTKKQSKALRNKGDGIRSNINPQHAGRAEFLNQKDELEHRGLFSSGSRVGGSPKTAVDSGKSQVSSALRSQASSGSQFEVPANDSTSSHAKWKSLVGSSEVRKKDFSSLKLGSSSGSTMEDSKSQKLNFESQVPNPEQLKRGQGYSNETDSSFGNRETVLSSKVAAHAPFAPDSFSIQSTSLGQREKQTKGNQDLNDELKVKANELEKLFAEHKLRVPADSNPTRRNRIAEPSKSAATSSYQEPVIDAAPAQLPTKHSSDDPAGGFSHAVNFNSSTPPKVFENQNPGDVLSNHFCESTFNEGSRGKHYETYLQKRNDKLKDEWSSRRQEKEAKLKAMQDSFERSAAEMKAKFLDHTNRMDSVSTARRRAERLRSFNTHSNIGTEQKRLDFGQSDDDEYLGSSQERKHSQDRSFNEDDISRSVTNKKLFLSKTSSSSTPRTTTAPIPKSANKSANIGSGRRKLQSENPLAQSVPNFSELRKENTKPSLAGTKINRPSRSYVRSKSTNEEVSALKEEKTRRPQSVRKSYANPGELREMFSAKPEGFLRKGNGKDFSIRTGVAKQKVSMTPDTLKSEEEFADAADELEDPTDNLNDDGDEELVSIVNEGHVNVGNSDQILSQESEKWASSDSENDNIVQSFSYVDPSMVAELPANVPDSAGGSPVSWNSRTRHPSAYTHEMSDIDASVDSPVGSPVSWNSHSLSQMESDAARMRKKWGAAQKPLLVTSSANNQSRKDMTKGFKRLLKFGRKTRGTENLVDWISATTSEGDDDTEDSRDPSNRLSEDLRKSRMGLPPDDSFNESDFSSEQVQAMHSSIPAPPQNFKLRDDHLSGSSIKAPRSFFSLSTFRSKGSDSKAR
ncbi:hypothetical protein LIER_04715 [Lithospermum erythrorhizon]|uniref:COP1-interacting protein 7 n=1 Tax=Lithospermum erythrorhizon TaxID=34254 RepID=A0AAV3NZ24_LITER